MANTDNITLKQLDTSMKTVKNYIDDKISLSGGGTDVSAIATTRKSNNLYTGTQSSYNGTTGTFSNYIEMKKGQYFITNLSATQYNFTNTSKVHQSSQYYGANAKFQAPHDGYLVVKMTSDANPVILEGTDINAHYASSVMISKSKAQPTSKWYGKRWLAIGDSITTDSDVYATNGYAKLISRELGMKMTNVAVSGKVTSYFYPLIDGFANNYDLVTVMLGTNDQGYACALGSLNDSYYNAGTYDSTSSFYARVQLLYEKLRAKYPMAVIIFLTPIRRTKTGTDGLGFANDANGYFKTSFTTKEYRDVIIDVCNHYAIPYVDLYNCIDPKTEINRTRYFMSAGDGTHPNNTGHALFIAPLVRDAIEKHSPYL